MVLEKYIKGGDKGGTEADTVDEIDNTHWLHWAPTH